MSNPRNRWILIGAVGSVLLLLIGYLLVISPAQGRLDEVNTAIETQESTNQQLANKLNTLKQQVAEVPAKMQEIKAVQAKMPGSMKQPALVRSLEQAAQRAGVQLTSISAGTPAAIEGSPGQTQLINLPYTLAATGSYSSLKNFVSNLERLDRAFLISTLDVSGGGDEFGELSMNVAGSFYSLENYDVEEPQNLPQPEAAPATPETPEPAPTTKKKKNKQKAQAAAQVQKKDSAKSKKKSSKKKSKKNKNTKNENKKNKKKKNK